MDKVLASVYNVDNLNRSAFLTTTSKQARLKSEVLFNRPEGISFFRFSFNLDPMSVDYRINQRLTFFLFCFRLPQHRYRKKEDRIEEIFSPAVKQLLQALQPETVDLK